MKQSKGERIFITRWLQLGDPELIINPEYHFAKAFAKTERDWRFDFAWIEYKVAVEIDGGVWTGGRHVRGQGFEDDLEKINRAIELGWVVLRYTPQMIERDPVSCIEQILNVIRSRKNDANGKF